VNRQVQQQQQQQQQQEGETGRAAAAAAQAQLPAVQLIAQQCSADAPSGSSSVVSEEHVVVTIRPATAAAAGTAAV
jgi:hypothetical protein